MAQIVDSYSGSLDQYWNIYSGDIIKAGQSFTGDGGTLYSCKFYMGTYGSPTGTAIGEIFAHSGTFGTSSVGTGNALATSGAIDVVGMSGWVEFTFTGANKITLINDTKYIVVVSYSGGDGANFLAAGWDNTSPTHDGNACYYKTTGWTADNTKDMLFYVYKDDVTAGSKRLLVGVGK